jgi:hypothetical protein
MVVIMVIGNRAKTVGERETYKDPCPSRFPSYSIHLSYSSCKKASKRSGKCGGREEDGGAYTKF